MICIGYGRNVIDHYYYGGEYIGSCSGGSVWNILSNIASLGGKAIALGTISGDYSAEIFINEMKQLKVDISRMVKKKRQKSNAMYVSIPEKYVGNEEVNATYKCPKCGKSHWDSCITKVNVDFSFAEGKELLLILDNIKNDNLWVINALRDSGDRLIVAQDLGHKYNLRFKDQAELIRYFSNIDVLQTKQDVIKLLLGRMKMTIDEMMQVCAIEKIIITNGDEGCHYHELKNNCYSTETYHPEEKFVVEDSSGAGDVFFARYLFKTFLCDVGGDEREVFAFCQNGVKEALNKKGAKANLGIELKAVRSEERCSCVIESKEKDFGQQLEGVSDVTLCVRNYKALKKKIKEMRIGTDNLGNRLSDQKKIYLCVGTGASYVAAVYTSQLLLSMGKMSVAIFPYEIEQYYKSDVDEILVFSASGKTYDNRELINKCIAGFGDASIRIVTSASRDTLIKYYPLDIRNNAIIYQTQYSYKEHGFLSFWGVLGPIIYVTMMVQEEDNEGIQVLLDRFEYWDKNTHIDSSIEALVHAGARSVDLIYASEYKAAAVAMESMFTESGIFRCILHEEKNYSHGRFVISENSTADFIIFIKGSETTSYEERLIKYLEKHNPIVILLEAGSRFAQIDAIIAVYSWIIKYSEMTNKDVSRPQYTNDSMLLYKYTR